MEFKTTPKATVKTIVKADAKTAYNAFIEPTILSKFWLSAASAPLQVGKTVKWEFMVPGISDYVTAKDLIPNKSIKIVFSNSTIAEWTFESLDDKNTIITIVNEGFQGMGDEQIAAALNSVEGFTWVLADLKTLLEQGKSAGIVKDKAWLIERSKR